MRTNVATGSLLPNDEKRAKQTVRVLQDFGGVLQDFGGVLQDFRGVLQDFEARTALHDRGTVSLLFLPEPASSKRHGGRIAFRRGVSVVFCRVGHVPWC